MVWSRQCSSKYRRSISTKLENFGGSDIMEVFMRVFPISQRMFDLTKYLNEGTWCVELIHVELLDRLGIEIQIHPISVQLPRF